MKKFAERLLDGTGTLFVFMATAAGVVVADRVLAGAGARVTWKDAVAGLVGAAAIVGKTELRQGSDFLGKRNRLFDRMLNGFSHGATYRMGGGLLVGALGG